MRLSTPMHRVRGIQEEEEGEVKDSLTSPVRFNHLIHGERLFHKTCRDLFACVDDMVPNWHRLNKDTVRADLYSEVVDALRSDVANESNGKPVFLSAPYHGGDRHMARFYQNAMAIVRHLGKSAILPTATTNPTWPEIVHHLEHGQSPHSRTDLIAIVFYLKLKMMLHDIKNRQAYGRWSGDVFVIEYQKSWLPYAHILKFCENLSFGKLRYVTFDCTIE